MIAAIGNRVDVPIAYYYHKAYNTNLSHKHRIRLDYNQIKLYTNAERGGIRMFDVTTSVSRCRNVQIAIDSRDDYKFCDGSST